MLELAVVAIAAGIANAIALFRRKAEPETEHPSTVEFKAFVEERTKEFLTKQDIEAMVCLVPEDRRADF